MKLYEERVASVSKSFYEKKDELLEIIHQKKENTIKMYNQKRDEALKAFNDKIDNLKKDVTTYVNERVNKFSKISSVEHHPEQFEKTATQKIKRFKYTKK